MGRREEHSQRTPRVLNETEKKRLLSKPNPKAPTGLRNLCILKLILETGVRLSELTALKNQDVDLSAGEIRIKTGDKERTLQVNNALLDILKKWNDRKPRTSSPYFFSTLKGGKLDERYIREMINRLAQKTGIQKSVSPQTLRHTFAFDLYKQTRNISLVQKALGHMNLSSTMVYAYMVEKEEEEEGMQFFRPVQASA